MRRVISVKHEQAEVDKYLLPLEIRVAAVRRHPAVLIAPAAEALGVLLVALVISFTVREERLVKISVWLITAAVLLGFFYVLVNWVISCYVITSDRILITSGIASRSVKMTLLSDLTDLEFTRSFAGRMFGYGALNSETGKVIYDFLPYPEELYLIVCGRILKLATAQEQVSEDREVGTDLDEATVHAKVLPDCETQTGYEFAESDEDDDL